MDPPSNQRPRPMTGGESTRTCGLCGAWDFHGGFTTRLDDHNWPIARVGRPYADSTTTNCPLAKQARAGYRGPRQGFGERAPRVWPMRLRGAAFQNPDRGAACGPRGGCITPAPGAIMRRGVWRLHWQCNLPSFIGESIMRRLIQVHKRTGRCSSFG